MTMRRDIISVMVTRYCFPLDIRVRQFEKLANPNIEHRHVATSSEGAVWSG
jgi:hypothetical protein